MGIEIEEARVFFLSLHKLPKGSRRCSPVASQQHALALEAMEELDREEVIFSDFEPELRLLVNKLSKGIESFDETQVVFVKGTITVSF